MRRKSSRRGSRNLRGGIGGLVFNPRCEVILGHGSNGTVSKQCTDVTCTKCYALKQGKYVSLDEAESSYLAWEAVKGTPFRNHILEYIATEETPHADPMQAPDVSTLTAYVPNYGDFRKVITKTLYASGELLTKDQLAHLLIQTFLTLDYLQQHSKMYHMDLKIVNLLATPWPLDAANNFIPEVLPATSANISFRLPGVKYWTYVIDFGNAVFVNDRGQYVGGTDIYKRSPWDNKCYTPAFDVFRLLVELAKLSEAKYLTRDAAKLLAEVVQGCFQTVPNFAKYIDKKYYVQEYMMLNGDACADIKSNPDYRMRTFAEVLINSPTLMREYAIPGAPAAVAAVITPTVVSPGIAVPSVGRAGVAAPAAAGAGAPFVLPVPVALAPPAAAAAPGVVVKVSPTKRAKKAARRRPRRRSA